MASPPVQKILFTVLRERAKPAQDRDLSFDLICRAIFHEDAGLFDRGFGTLDFDVPRLIQIGIVDDLLCLWPDIEEPCGERDGSEQSRVRDEARSLDELCLLDLHQRRMGSETLRLAGILAEDMDLLDASEGRSNGEPPFDDRPHPDRLEAFERSQPTSARASGPAATTPPVRSGPR